MIPGWRRIEEELDGSIVNGMDIERNEVGCVFIAMSAIPKL